MSEYIKCKHCGDTLTVWKCQRCGCAVLDECVECHDELTHGNIPNVTAGKDGVAQVWLSDKQYHGGYSE